MPGLIFNVPFICPIKFYKVVPYGTAGIHFDDDFFVNQTKSFETKYCYRYKAQFFDPMTIQVASSVMPGNLKVYDSYGKVQFIDVPFVQKMSGAAVGYNIYEASFNFYDFGLVEGVYYFYSEINLFGTISAIISEPIDLTAKHDSTLLFTYWNTLNNFGTTFTTGVKYNFRCEAGIMDFQPESEITDYIDQVRNVEILSGVPYRVFKLYIGKAPGVAPYIADILNRVFCCDHVNISKDGTNQKRYVKPSSSKWEVSRQKGWPGIGLSTDILEGENLDGIQINTEIAANLWVNSYLMETGFFGGTTGLADAVITERQMIN